MTTQDRVAAVRRVLMYWGNIGKVKQRNLRRLAEIEQEIESAYDIRPQQLTGMPHGTQIRDMTGQSAERAIYMTAGLKAEREMLQRDTETLDRDFDMIRHEVMCLPPLQSEVITLRYCEYGYAKRGYWAKIAERVRTTEDNAKRTERKAVLGLMHLINVEDTGKEATQGHE